MMESLLWHVMNVLSLSVDLVMSTREEKETNLVLSVKLVTSVSKVTSIVTIGLSFLVINLINEVLERCVMMSHRGL